MKYTNYVWDPNEMSYEDFLETLPPEAVTALAEGNAFLAKPMDGFKVLSRFNDSMKKDGGDSWIEWANSLETMDECGQAVTELIALQHPVKHMVDVLKARAVEIYLEAHPEEAEKAERKKAAMDKISGTLADALGSVMDELDEAMDPTIKGLMKEFMDLVAEKQDDDDEKWKKGG